MKAAFLIILFSWNYVMLFSQRVDSMRFSLDKGLLVIPGKINGSDVSFIFDTGAGITVTTQSGNEAAGVSYSKKSINVRDANKNISTVKQVNFKSVSVGGFSKQNIEGVTYDMPFMVCQNLQLLGQDFINSFHWKFDFEKGWVYISDKPFETQGEFKTWDISIIKNRPHVNLDVNGQKLNCLIDFGFRGYLDLNKKNEELKNFFSQNSKQGSVINYYQRPMGLTSTHKGEVVQLSLIDSLSLSGLVFKDMPASLSEYTGIKIGLHFFMTYCNTLLINSESQRYLLETKEAPAYSLIPFDAGFTFEDGKIIISEINLSPNSTAANLKIDESIKSVNGIPAEHFKDLCDLLKWKFEYKNPEIKIEKADGSKIDIKRQSIFQ